MPGGQWLDGKDFPLYGDWIIRGRYVERGSMASMGFGRGVADLTKTGLGDQVNEP